MSPEQLKRHNIVRETPLSASKGGGDTEKARRYLAKVAMRLSDGEILPPAVRHWIADALTEIVLDPSCAGRVLGLARSANRPASPKTQVRNVQIARRIYALSASMPIHASNAIPDVATEFNVSESVAEKAWAEYGQFVKLYAEDVDAIHYSGGSKSA